LQRLAPLCRLGRAKEAAFCFDALLAFGVQLLPPLLLLLRRQQLRRLQLEL